MKKKIVILSIIAFLLLIISIASVFIIINKKKNKTTTKVDVSYNYDVSKEELDIPTATDGEIEDVSDATTEEQIDSETIIKYDEPQFRDKIGSFTSMGKLTEDEIKMVEELGYPNSEEYVRNIFNYDGNNDELYQFLADNYEYNGEIVSIYENYPQKVARLFKEMDLKSEVTDVKFTGMAAEHQTKKNFYIYVQSEVYINASSTEFEEGKYVVSFGDFLAINRETHEIKRYGIEIHAFYKDNGQFYSGIRNNDKNEFASYGTLAFAVQLNEYGDGEEEVKESIRQKDELTNEIEENAKKIDEQNGETREEIMKEYLGEDYEEPSTDSGESE